MSVPKRSVDPEEVHTSPIDLAYFFIYQAGSTVAKGIVYIARGLDILIHIGGIWLNAQTQGGKLTDCDADSFHCLGVQCDLGTRSGSKYCLTEKEASYSWQRVRSGRLGQRVDQKRTPHCQERFKK